MGRIRPELPLETGHWHHPVSMHPGLPASTIPLVRRTFQRPSGERLDTTQRGDMEPSTSSPSTCSQAESSTGRQTPKTQPRIPRRTVGMAVCPRPPTTFAMLQTQSQVRGSFSNTRQITPVSFELNVPNHYRISPTFHVSLLKPADGPGEGPEEPLEDADPLPISGEEEEIYQVRDLLDSRRRGRTLQYLVDWEGYGPEERSWVDTEDILDPSLVEEFHRDHPERPAPRPRGRPRRRPPPRFRSRSQGGGFCHGALLRLPVLVIDGNHHPSISLTTSPSSPVPGTHYLSHLSPITWAI